MQSQKEFNNEFKQKALNSSLVLPVTAYFDQTIFDAEMDYLFANAPIYYGHELMVPNDGDYHTLEWLNHSKMLKKDGNEIKLLSNICRHRQATILTGRGNGKYIICDIHNWVYNNNGELMATPRMSEKICSKLNRTKIINWNGLLFDAKYNVNKDLGSLPMFNYIDFTGYNYHRSFLTEYNFNWKTFIEVYTENYHVDSFHKGLSSFVDCDDLKWLWSDHYQIQTVGFKNGLSNPGTEIYKKWSNKILNITNKKLNEYGAVWFLYYPNIMIEYYPYCLVISVVLPKTPETCSVTTEFYYPENILQSNPDLIEAEQAAYFETAKEDDDICNRMQEGRKNLWIQGINELGPYQTPGEDGMHHFHQYYRKLMSSYLMPDIS